MAMVVSALLAHLDAQAQSAYFQAATNLNPVAYWPLQETTQPPPADVETNRGSLGPLANAYISSAMCLKGATGVIVSEPSNSSIFIQANPPLTLTGGFLAVPLTDQRVAVPFGPFTVEAWIAPTNYSGVGILSQTGPSGSGGLNGSANSAGWSLTEDYIASQNSGNLQGWCFHVFNGAGLGGAEAVAGPGFVANGATWYHIVGVFDGTNATLYVNGTNASASGYQIPMPPGTSYVRDTWDPLFIGAARGFNNNRFAGLIDEVAVYTNALAPSQVLNHYNTALNPSPATPYEQVVASDHAYMYWRMDSPNYVPPSSSTYPAVVNYGSLGSSLNGLYNPGTVVGVSGPPFTGFGGGSVAVAINGIGGNGDLGGAQPMRTCVDVPHPSLLNPVTPLNPTGNTNSFSVAGWFRGNSADANGRFECVAGHSDSSWRFALNNGNSRWNYGGSGAGDVIINASTINVNDGNWHQFVGAYDAVAHVQTLWIDGAVSGSGASSGNIPGSTVLDVLLGAAPDNVDAGNGNVYNQRFFPGSVAHMAFFTNALTTAQIKALYQAAGTPPAIYAQPASGISTNSGATTKTFSVSAAGATNLIYQWFFDSSSNYTGASALTDDSVHITGSTNSTLTITNLVDAESGFYFVVVTNNYGAVTSIFSGLQVYQEPLITSQSPTGPFNLFVNQNFTLSVTAIGSAPLGYLWYTNGVADTVAGTSASYTLSSVQSAMSGETFRCVVSNSTAMATNALATLTVLPLPTNPYAQAILAFHPSGYWPMHEVEPPAQGDIETNYGTLGVLADGHYGDWQGPNNGTTGNPGNSSVFHRLVGALAGDTNGAAGFARASGGYVIIPHTSPLATLKAPFTLEAWVEPFDNSFGVILGQGGNAGLNGSGNRGGFSWNWAGSANTFSLSVWNGVGGNNTEPKTVAIYQPGQWYHLVTTFDGSSVTYYINGSPASLQNSPAATLNPDSWSPLAVGGGRWGSGINNQFDGAIDEVAVYTNLLDPNEIAAHYAAGINPSASPSYKSLVLATNPIIYLRMDSPVFVTPPLSTWPVLTNYGTAGINGVYRPGSRPGGIDGPSAAGVPVTGLGANTALAGDGISVYADAGYSSAFNPTNGNAPFSVSCWFKGNPADVARNWQTLIGHTDQGWRCAINGGSGKIGFDSGNGLDVASTQVYNDGNWHQVVGTYDGSNTTVYVDGQFSASGNRTSANQIQTTFGVLLASSPNGQTNASGGRSWAGNMCEAAVFNTTLLSSNDVKTLYAAVGVAPQFVTQPVSGAVNGNTSFTFISLATGSLPLSYQWYKNNLPLINQTNANLALTSVTAADTSTNYYVVVTNNILSVTSTVVSLIVATNPVFTLEPAFTNITLYAGGHATFSIAASGGVPLGYQWYSNTLAIAGATNTSYTLTNAQTTGPTNFFCTVSNIFGMTNSFGVSVSVIPAPSAPYPAMVLSANPIGFWRLNEADQGGGNAGVTANDYWGGNDGIYTNTSLGQPGYNAFTEATTSAEFGNLSLNDCDAFNIGGVNFASASGSPAFSIEAWVNASTQTKDAGIVTKGFSGSEQFDLDMGGTSHGFRFFVRDNGNNTHIVSTAIQGGSVWHHVVGVCDEPHGVVTLYIDGVAAGTAPINPGSGILASSTPMTIGSRATSSTSGNDIQFVGNLDDVAIYNSAVTASQVQAHFFSAGIVPFITQQPPSVTNVNENGTVSIPAAVSGTPPLSYQWYNQNTSLPVPNQTNATLTLANVSSSLNGVSFYLTVSNIYGGTVSSPVGLTVNSGQPLFVKDLPSQVVAVTGAPFTYFVQLAGTEPFTYQWYKGASPVGPNSPSYAVGAVAGTYSVVVANGFGSVTSVVSTLSVVQPAHDSYGTTILGYGPVGYWPLNETNPPPQADIETNLGSLGPVGNAYYVSSLQVLKGQPGALAGDSDPGITLNGQNGSWLGIPRLNPALTLSNSFSVEAWVKPADYGFAAILSQSDNPFTANNGYSGSGNVRGWTLWQNGGVVGNFSFHLYSGSGGGGQEPKESSIYSTTTWNHLVAVWDGALVYIFVNGVQSVSAASQSSFAPNFSQPIEIGGSGMNNNRFNGSIDEVAIYSNALSPLQIETHYEAGTNSASNYKQVILNDHPYLYYRMDSPTYTPPSTNTYPQAVNYGSLGASENGFYQPGTLPGQAGPPTFGFGGSDFATAINGLNSCVDIPYHNLLDLTGQTPFSISAWFKGNPADGAGRWEDIFGHSDSSWVFHMNNTVPNFNIGFNGGSGDLNIPTSSVNPNDGNWHFFAGTYDGSKYTIFVDTFSNSVTSVHGIPGYSGDPLIGGDPQFVEFGNNGGFNERYFPGNISQVGFFTNALTAAQVKTLYSVGTNKTITLSMARSGANVVVTWNTGTLQSSTNVLGPFTPVPGATLPTYTIPAAGAQQFFRVTFP
jgi:hypothetical protein